MKHRIPWVDSMDALLYAGAAAVVMISLGILIFLVRWTP